MERDVPSTTRTSQKAGITVANLQWEGTTGASRDLAPIIPLSTAMHRWCVPPAVPGTPVILSTWFGRRSVSNHACASPCSMACWIGPVRAHRLLPGYNSPVENTLAFQKLISWHPGVSQFLIIYINLLIRQMSSKLTGGTQHYKKKSMLACGTHLPEPRRAPGFTVTKLIPCSIAYCSSWFYPFSKTLLCMLLGLLSFVSVYKLGA